MAVECADPQVAECPVTQLTWAQVRFAVGQLYNTILARCCVNEASSPLRVFGIPSGGSVIAALLAERPHILLVDSVDDAEVLVDDMYETGATMRAYGGAQHTKFVAYYKSPANPFQAGVWGEVRLDNGVWVKFPWEGEHVPESNVQRILEYLGEDPQRDGLIDTPRRVLAALAEMTVGYRQNPEAILGKRFMVDYPSMVVVRNVAFTSLCEHHMLPFVGMAHVAYVPGAEAREVVGLSKLARLVECYARRLQVQERMTNQIASAVMEHLQASGAGCIVVAKHQCMACRGVRKAEAEMVTSSLLGTFKEGPVRAEFLTLCGLA